MGEGRAATPPLQPPPALKKNRFGDPLGLASSLQTGSQDAVLVLEQCSEGEGKVFMQDHPTLTLQFAKVSLL